MQIYYVYLDYTDEIIPRVFYVGKGNTDRIKTNNRNKYWKCIVNKYGWKRQIILATKDEKYAFEIEVEQIKKYQTYEADCISGWGANLTMGGEGSSGWKPTEKWKQNQSKNSTGNNNGMWGKIHSQETKNLIAQSRMGTTHSIETKRQMSLDRIGTKNGNYGNHLSEENKRKISNANKNKNLGENHPRAKLTQIQVELIRQEYKNTNTSYNVLAKKYNVSKVIIARIITYKTYK